jgi:hypothetical protein
MGGIIIRKVIYQGNYYFYESPELSEGLNIICGPNGTGKSTFINFIYYALSGKVDEFTIGNRASHYEITSDTNNYVEVKADIGGETFTLRRFINKNDIAVKSGNEEIVIYPVYRSKNEKQTFSDWILEKLGIEVVEIYQGVNSFKLNFTDLMRLVYHNQEPDPKRIFKPSNNDNFISDSEVIRKVIFEILVGKTYSEYYRTLAAYKESEKSTNVKLNLLNEYKLIATKLSEGYEDLNIVYLKEKRDKVNGTVLSLYGQRESIKSQRQDNDYIFREIADVKSELILDEINLQDLEEQLQKNLFEIIKINRLKENIVLEATQLSKIITAHEKLNLFSADTCPYCLREVNREKGHCVCGAAIDEEQYERFFYTTEEYLDILKSKQKSVKTVEAAHAFFQNEKSDIQKSASRLRSEIKGKKEKILRLMENVEDGGNMAKLSEIDDQILKFKSEINILDQRIEMEHKRQLLQKEYDDSVRVRDSLKDQLAQLEAGSRKDIKEKIIQFNQTYNSFMVETLKDCRNAKIDNDNYMPIINDGEYREASAYVPIRLMYYLTLMYISLRNEGVKYPRLLLVDTPATAGIDVDNLITCLRQISKIKALNFEYQIILSTGVDNEENVRLYPKEFEIDVKIVLTNDARLLKRKDVLNENII